MDKAMPTYVGTGIRHDQDEVDENLSPNESEQTDNINDNSKIDAWVIMKRESLYFSYYSLFKDDDYHQENKQNADEQDREAGLSVCPLTGGHARGMV